jgi:hypothetical protein
MLNGTVNATCSRARAGSPAGPRQLGGERRDRRDEDVQLAKGIAHGDAHRVHLAKAVEDLRACEADGGLHPRTKVRQHAAASLGRKSNPVAVAAHPPETVKAAEHLLGDQRLHRLDVRAGALERGSGGRNGVADLGVDGKPAPAFRTRPMRRPVTSPASSSHASGCGARLM